ISRIKARRHALRSPKPNLEDQEVFAGLELEYIFYSGTILNMAEDLHLGSRVSPARTPTLRDVATIVFRHKRLLVTSFLVILSAGVLYAVLSPSYKAEMKILVRRGRIDPVLTPTQTVSPAFAHDEISEEEMNSE